MTPQRRRDDGRRRKACPHQGVGRHETRACEDARRAVRRDRTSDEREGTQECGVEQLEDATNGCHVTIVAAEQDAHTERETGNYPHWAPQCKMRSRDGGIDVRRAAEGLVLRNCSDRKSPAERDKCVIRQ